MVSMIQMTHMNMGITLYAMLNTLIKTINRDSHTVNSQYNFRFFVSLLEDVSHIQQIIFLI